MYYEAVIFDLDGTLLDTLKDIAMSANEVLGDRGYLIHSIEQYKAFVGSGVSQLFRAALPEQECNEALIAQCVVDFMAVYHRRWKDHTCIYPGVSQLLDALTVEGLKFAVLSNKPHASTVECVSEMLRSWKFVSVLGHQEGSLRKPDPEGALKTANTLCVDPVKCIFVGDTWIDMDTACNAGMFPVGVLWGFREEEELREHGAKEIIKSPLDLLNIIGIS